MEIHHLIKDELNLNEYISITRDVLNRRKNLKFTINLATVLTLKKIRSLEIEYLNKCDENGVACIVFEGLLASPPSKTWGVLAKDLLNLLQYWLETIRKHFVNHSTRWWMFLKLMLKFIKEIRLKHPTVPNMLVELTADCLFDLATAPKRDVFQRHEILHCLNMVCADSGRQIRFAMRTMFGDYFVKVAFQMATSGYLPCQYSALECLMRWLVPRQDQSLRVASAEKWLPLDLCPAAAKTLFLNSPWMNFFQDARTFLNILNEGNGLVTSVICRRIKIGEIELINGSEPQQSWLDFNTTGKSISVLLDPRVLKVFGVVGHRACETLLIGDEITETALLRREPLGLTISLTTLTAPYIRPIDISAGNARQLSIVVSSRADLRTLDGAMRNTFGDKYQLLIDLDTDVSQSPQRSYSKKNELTSEEDTRFSHPVEPKRRKQSGHTVNKSRNPAGLISPSSVSTSSLAHLRDRLTALPRYEYDKVPVSVCAEPALSHVSEGTERDDCSIVTHKFQLYGVCNRSTAPPNHDKTEENKSKSEGETVKPNFRSRGGRGILSPVASDDNCASLLLVATIGSNNDSVINDTIKRLSKSKDFQEDNIVDLLMQDALQYKPKSKDVCNSSINLDENKSQVESEAIDDTPKEIKESKSRVPFKKNCTVISKSTTDDESNTEAINETPVYVKSRKNISNKTIAEDQRQTVEDFFSHHVAENAKREIMISPSLAKKINETGSETSENLDDLYMNEAVHTDVEEKIFNEIDIIDCLDDMVDKVCNDNKLAKCQNIPMRTVKEKEVDACFENKNAQPLQKQKLKRNIKPKNKPVRKRRTKKIKKLEQESTKKMTTIIEQKEEDTILEEINPEIVKVLSPEKKNQTPSAKDTDTSFMRRKRKLYSPKDDDIENKIQEFTIAQASDNASLTEIKTRSKFKTTATCYKELEKERQNYIRLPRSRKSKGKFIDMPSPRTIKMDSMFDNLKQTVGGNEEIILVDKNADVYNFSSESDDDFRKKIEIKKGVSPTAKKRRIRRVKESDSSYEETKKPLNRKTVTKRTNKRGLKAKTPFTDLIDTNTDLVDERMRDAAKEELNTSIIIEHSTNVEPVEIEPALKEVIRMEEIDDSVSNDTLLSKNNYNKEGLVHGSELNTLASKKSTKKTKVEQKPNNKSNAPLVPKRNVRSRVNKNTELLSIKKEKGLAKKAETIIIPEKEDEGTISPLPGLVVESMPTKKEDNINDNLLTKNMLQKFQRLYRDGPDVTNDTINTQNMLSDVERLDYSAQNCFEEEISFVNNNKEKLNASRDKYQKDKKVAPAKTIKYNENKYKIKPNENIETIDIIDKNDSQLEKSIATDGITAHGDYDEAPPNSDNINEALQPRELLDMDQSSRNYFIKLTRELRSSDSKGRDSKKSVDGEEVRTILRNECEKTKNVNVISPIVSVKRLSLKDISRWMPSRRTSDTDSPETSPKLSQTYRKDYDEPETTPIPIPNKRPKTYTSGSSESKTPTVQNTKISLEEFEKWLPMPKSFEERNVSSAQKDKSSDFKRVYRTRSKDQNAKEGLPSVTKQKAVEDTTCTKKRMPIETDPHSVHIDSVNTRKFRNRAATLKAECAICVLDIESGNEKEKDSAMKMAKTSKNSTRKKRKQIQESNSNDELHEPYTFNMKDARKTKVRRTKTDTDSDKTSSRNQIVKPTVSPIKLTDDFVSNIEDIEDSEESPVTLKRKSTTPLLSQPKMQKIDEPRAFVESKNRHMESKRYSEITKAVEILEDVVISASGPSLSSVNDWFRRTGHSDHSTPMSYKDIILNVLEKVDTTLVETNQNTSTKLVNLVVETQKNMSAQMDEQRNMCRSIAREMIINIVGIIEKMFIDLHQKNRETNEAFIDKFKDQAFKLIRDDCKQKRAMVQMLKDDVLAVDKYIASRNDS